MALCCSSLQSGLRIIGKTSEEGPEKFRDPLQVGQGVRMPEHCSQLNTSLPGDGLTPSWAENHLRCLSCVWALIFPIRKLSPGVGYWWSTARKSQTDLGGTWVLWLSSFIQPKGAIFSTCFLPADYRVSAWTPLEMGSAWSFLSIPLTILSHRCRVLLCNQRESGFRLYPLTAALQTYPNTDYSLCVVGKLSPPWIPLPNWTISGHPASVSLVQPASL